MTASEILNIAAQQVGYTESPPNSNRTKYGAWYGLDGQPWCMMFVQWCFAQAGEPLPYKTASCSALERWYRKNRPESIHSEPQPGDIVIYDFGHTGIVESAQNATITAIEGNTSPGVSGSQNNGGGVYRRVRSISTVTAFIRPDYIESEEYDVTEAEYQKWLAGWKRFRAELQDKPGSNWSQADRDWAVNNGTIRGDENGRYMWQDFLTREQYAATEHRQANETKN